jgi:MFS transporter, OFA family, oxalate/formate antiporter
MPDNKTMSRWWVVVGAILVQLCLGAIYAWGTFSPSLQWTKSEVVNSLAPALLSIDRTQHGKYKNGFAECKKMTAKILEAAKKSDATEEEKRLGKEAQTQLENFHTRLPVAQEVWAKHYFGYSAKQSQGIFSAGLFFFAFVMILAGRWQDRVGPRIVALTGGVVLGLGYILASFVGTNYWLMFLCVGVIGGSGIGLGYVCPIAACVKWFPDMKGFITGLAVAGFGAGAFIFVKLGGPWADLIFTCGVSTTYLIFGIIFVITVVLGSLLLSNPPPGWKPEGWIPPAPKNPAAATKARDLTQSQCVRTPQFWMIWFAFVFSAGCGLMVIGCLKDFGIREGGLSAEAAGTALGLLALFNGLGRIVWGTLTQKVGARNALVMMALLQAGMMFLLLGMGTKVVTLAIAACWVGFNFGGNFAVFPLLTAEDFGTKNLGANYGAVFTAYGIGGIVGPILSGGVWDALGSYQWAFIPAGVGCLVTAALGLLLKAVQSKNA